MPSVSTMDYLLRAKCSTDSALVTVDDEIPSHGYGRKGQRLGWARISRTRCP